MTPEPRGDAADPRGRAVWLPPLVATLLLQATAAYLTRLTPTIAPALAADLGWTVDAVGALAALSTIGSMLFLLLGAPLIRRAGPIRALQIGLGVGAVGALVLGLPFGAAAILASLLVGLGYGPSAPAGSDVLQRTAPAAHRNLIFSIKQAGVPIGGVVAGLLLPFLAEAYGWRAALAVSAAIALATVALVQPLRGRIDAHRDRGLRLTPGAFLSLDNLRGPLRVLRAEPRLTPLIVSSACFAMAQGAWFAFLVSTCVVALGLSLTAAGLVFAIMQATGVVGRIVLGWASDRLGSGMTVLRLAALASAATSCAFALASPAWPFWALCLLAGIGGVTVSSWNGVQVAESARLAPAGLVAETAAAVTLLVFVGYVAGPTGYALILALTGRFDVGYLVIAATTLAGFAALTGRRA